MCQYRILGSHASLWGIFATLAGTAPTTCLFVEHTLDVAPDLIHWLVGVDAGHYALQNHKQAHRMRISCREYASENLHRRARADEGRMGLLRME